MGIIDTWPPVIIGVMPTGSMNPYIEPGDIFFVDNAASFQDVKTKDVIVYTLDNTRIAHRVVERTDVELITQGDMNPIRDRLPVLDRGTVYRRRLRCPGNTITQRVVQDTTNACSSLIS